MMSGQLPPRKIAPRTISPWMIAPGQLRLGLIAPEKNCTLNNGSRGKLPPGQFAPWKTAPGKSPAQNKISFENNCPHSSKFRQRVLRVNWGKLSIVYEYYNIWVLQLSSKKGFTSIYLLQILTKPCGTPLIRKHLSLNASRFSYARTNKNTIFWKSWFGKKYKKTS